MSMSKVSKRSKEKVLESVLSLASPFASYRWAQDPYSQSLRRIYGVSPFYDTVWFPKVRAFAPAEET